MDKAIFLDLAKRVLRILGGTAEEQLAYLQSAGNLPVDELALELDDLIGLVRSMCSDGVITTEQRDAMLSLDSLLTGISGPANTSFWTASALQNEGAWDQIRDTARQALYKLNESSNQGFTN